jgi:hypothetical protein
MQQLEQLVLGISANVERVVERLDTMEDRAIVPTTPVHAKTQADVALTPKTQELTNFFKIPPQNAPAVQRELFLMQAKMTFEQPLTQERNKHEVASIFRVIRVLLDGPMDNTTRKAIMTMLVRAKEISLMESSGVKFASVFASHIHMDTQSNIISSAHSAALLADKPSSTRRRPHTKDSKRRPKQTKEGDGAKTPVQKK